MGRTALQLSFVALPAALLLAASCHGPLTEATTTDPSPVGTDPTEPAAFSTDTPPWSHRGDKWHFELVEDREGRVIGTLYARGQEGSSGSCKAWSEEILATQLLPRRIEHETTELGGTPVLAFEPNDPSRMLSGIAGDFAVTLRATYQTKECATCPLSDEATVSAGTSTVLHRNDLLCLEPAPSDPDCQGIERPLLHWWGRRTADPSSAATAPGSVSIDPFSDVVVHRFSDTRDTASLEIWLDLFKWADDPSTATPVKERDQAACVLRFFELPGGNGLPTFAPQEPLAERPSFPTMKDECYYEEPFNPFWNRDLITRSDFAHKGRAEHGLPNTFADAVDGFSCECDAAGCSSTICERGDPSFRELLPRLQLVGSNDFSRFMPLETYCNEQPEICQTLDTPRSAAAFNQRFGLAPFSTIGESLLTSRHRRDDGGPSSAPWGGSDGSGDFGVWTKPRFKAGYGIRITAILRNEGETSYTDAVGHSYDTAFCDPLAPAPSGRILYFDKQGRERQGVAHPFECLPCNSRAQDESLPPPYRGVHAQYCPSHYGIEQEEGIRLKSVGSMVVPGDARGSGVLEIRAALVARNDSTDRIPFTAVRRFPIYVDGLHQGFVQGGEDGEDVATVRARQACWIGATAWVRDSDNKMIKLQVLPSALDHYLEQYLKKDKDLLALSQPEREIREKHLEAVDDWLLGGDVNRWFKRKTGDKAQLMTLAGDVQTRGNALPWFDYRGSSVHFEQYQDESGKPAWVEAEDGVAAGTSCPVMRPILRDNGVPLEMIRSTGQNRENGRSHLVQSDGKTEIHIDHCQETNKETIAPVSGFQFSDQQQRGDAYIWFYVGRDWGWVSPFAHADEGDEIKKRYDLMSMLSLGVGRYEYNTQLPPWGSFLAHWDKERGVDDLARSVAWTCLDDQDGDGNCGSTDVGTTFLNTAPIVTSDLGQAVSADKALFKNGQAEFDADTLDGAEGLLVWHAGSYRTSPLYFSFVTRKDALHPERYWHFAGLAPTCDGSGTIPVWSRLEKEAVPIVWDHFGEFTVVDLRMRNGQDLCEQRTVFQDFVLVYPPIGHEGIVLREARQPFGPFSDIIPMYGHRGNATQFGEKMYQESGIRPLTAYSGYTHVDLWGDSVCEDGVPKETKVRFNVSIWTPYKTLLVEADVRRVLRPSF